MAIMGINHVMVNVPLANNAYERIASLLPEVVCRNIFVERDDSDPANPQVVRIQRPGLTLYRNLPAINRGIYYSEAIDDNRIYAVAGASLVAIDASNVGYSIIGPISNDELNVSFAPSFDKFAIASAGDLYTYNKPATGSVPVFGKITMPDDRDVIAVAELNNYIIVGCPDGRFYWMNPGENTVDPLNFLTAESSTDGLIAIQKVGDELYFFGNSSTEIWSATGDDDIPFIRSQGRNFTRGILDRDTCRIIDNTAFWVANNGVVYRASNVPDRVSNHGIEERISKRNGILSALTVVVDAHEFYVLKIPGQGSYAYDAATKQWSEFSTLGADTWRPAYSVAVSTTVYLADSTTGKLWIFDPNSFTDDGTSIDRTVTASIDLPARPSRNDNLRLDVGSSGNCNYRVRWKDALSQWSPYVTLKAKPGNDRISLYRLGQAKGQYRTFEVSVLDPVRIRIGQVNANDSWQR